MDWILQHFQIVVAIVVIVFWVLKSIAGGKKADEEHSGPMAAPPPVADPGEEDRTRQIQEEIRRRILARQRGETTPPPLPPPRPVIVQREEPELADPDYPGEGPNVPMPTAAAHRQSDTAQAAILEQQRLLAEQLHALRAARAAGTSVPPVPAVKLPAHAAAAIAGHQLDCRRELRRDLHHSSSVRRAILLKEILGEPLALQRGRTLPRR